MIIKQLSIFVENRPGRLAEITEAIGGAGIDIRALSIADTSDFGILRLIVDRPEEAVIALKESGVTVTLTDVVAVAMNDKPGAFARVVRMLSDGGVNIEYMYAFISRTGGEATLIIRLEDIAGGMEILKAGNVPLLSSDQIYNL